MAQIRITLEDAAGRQLAGTEPRVYDLGDALDNLHDIEGALEDIKRQVLPDLTEALLAKAQAAQIEGQKKETA